MVGLDAPLMLFLDFYFGLELILFYYYIISHVLWKIKNFEEFALVFEGKSTNPEKTTTVEG